jgi:hypothetical protein
MHNLDRTQIGYGQEMGDFEFSSGQTVFNENEQIETYFNYRESSPAAASSCPANLAAAGVGL